MKFGKIFSLLIKITIISLIITGCGSSSSNTATENETNGESKPITLKVAAYVAPTTSLYKLVLDPWIQRATELTEGKVKFEVYPGEQLGKVGDMVQLIGDGVADIGIFNANLFMDNMPLTSALAGLPNLSSTAYQGTMAFNDLVQENSILQETDYLRNGIRPIFTHVSPTYEIWSKDKVIKVPEDLKGLKIRTPGGVANEVYSSLGVVPVTITQPEIYEAIEKGVVEAVSSSSIAIESSGINNLVKQVVSPHIGTVVHSLSINEKVWKGLPEDIQKALIQAGKDIQAQSGTSYDEFSLEINDKFVKDGGSIIELTEEEQQQWKQVTEEFTESWIKEKQSKEIPYEDVMNQYKELLEKYKEN